MSSAADLQGGMTCAEVSELAGLYVLDALEPAERERVDAHLASCPEAHAEVAELGAAVPALALAAGDVVAPAALKSRVLSDYRASQEHAAPAARPVSVARPAPLRDITASLPFWQRPRLGWAAAAAAVLVIAVAGGWAWSAQSRADNEARRADAIAQAVHILADPGSTVAVLRGHDAAAGASGFVAFAADGSGYIVLVDVPAAPAGQTYQAWYIDDGHAASAGLLSVDAEGFALMPLAAVTGTDIVALTIEPASGSTAPTTDPVIVGEMRPNA